MCEVVSFDLAVKLKEKGFYYKSFATYDKDGMLGYNYVQPEKTCAIGFDDCLCSNNIEDNNCIDAPTISQVLNWLRENHNLFIVVFLNDDSDNPVTFEIYKGVECVTNYHIKYYPLDEWSKAEIDAIEYVLDNLI